jgi:2,4-dienoyl-CoA reductase (NADPH2)
MPRPPPTSPPGCASGASPTPALQRGGVCARSPEPPAREVRCCSARPASTAPLGKTTGWIHRAALKMKNVQMLAGVNYERIGPSDSPGASAFVSFGEQPQGRQRARCRHIVLCAGQEPLRELQAPLRAAGVKVHLIGGALEAGELDAKRAIDQGTRLAATL